MGSHTVVSGKPIALLSSVVFVQFAQRWSCLCWLGELSSAAGLDQARLLLPSNEIVRSPKLFDGSKLLLKLWRGVAPPPSVAARCQRGQGQGEERCWLVYCQLLSERPHVLKTLASVKWGLFDSRVVLVSIEGLRRFLGLEVVSRLQKAEDVITCK